MSFGVWFNSIEVAYQLLRKYEIFQYTIKEELKFYDLSDENVNESVDNSDKLPCKSEYERVDNKVTFLAFLSGFVSPRVVLLQLIPVLTIVSVFAVGK